MTPVRLNGRTGLILAVLGAAIAVRAAISLRVYHYFIDDAYIFLRYAENFADGRGLVFNPGERVLGFTSPLYMLALASLVRVFRAVDPGVLISVLNFSLFAAFAGFILRTFPAGQLRSWALPLLLFFYFPFVDASLNGMETMLVLTTMTGTLSLLATSHRTAAIVVAALTALVRPEGCIFFALVTAFLWLEHRNAFPWRGFAVAAVLGSGWAVFAGAQYGTVLPQSLLAKSSHAWGGGRPVQHNLLEMHLYLSLALTDTIYHGLRPALRSALAACSLAGGVLFAFSFIELARRRSPLVVAPVFYTLTLLGYSIGRPIDLSSWHTIPTAVMFLITVGVGLDGLLARLGSRVVDATVLAAVVLVCGFSFQSGLARRAASINAVQQSMERLAEHVRRTFPTATSIASGHIGLLGLRSNLRIVDLGALVTPAVMGDRYLSDLVRREQPDVIVLANTILEEGMDPVFPHPFRDEAERSSFLARYTGIQEGGLPHLFVRNDLLQAPPAD